MEALDPYKSSSIVEHRRVCFIKNLVTPNTIVGDYSYDHERVNLGISRIIYCTITAAIA